MRLTIEFQDELRRNKRRPSGKFAIVFHHNFKNPCRDGAASAYLLKVYLLMMGIIDIIDVGWEHGNEKKTVDELIAEGYTKVYFVDCIPTPELLKKLADESPKTKMEIFDHHKDAYEKVNTWLKENSEYADRVRLTYENGKAATQIVWEAFFAGEMPVLFLNIALADVWKHKQYTDAYMCGIQSVFGSFKNLSASDAVKYMGKVFKASPLQIGLILKFGREDVAKQKKYVEDHWKENMLAFLFGMQMIYMIPMPSGASNGTRYATLYAQYFGGISDYFFMYSVTSKDGKPAIKVSVRRGPAGSEKKLDCSELARKLGGNGHDTAASFIYELTEDEDILVFLTPKEWGMLSECKPLPPARMVELIHHLMSGV
jgi:nanoRNase/pAp phosphatase (c-di-AMP/oligoRNAs hydrolase)